MTSFLGSLLAGAVLSLVQVVAALPWLWLLDQKTFKATLRTPAGWGYLFGGVLAGGAVLAALLLTVRDPVQLERYGRLYATLLHLQLAIDAFIVVFGLVLLVWPKGGAVALAA